MFIYFRINISEKVPLQKFHQNYNLTPVVNKINKNNQIPKDLTSTLIDSNINQISWSNNVKPTTSLLSQSKSMGFENKTSSENYSVNSQIKPMSLQTSANNWNDLWTKHEETQQPIKKLSLSDINDLLS